jgi:solute carrier family 25 protein 34/35
MYDPIMAIMHDPSKGSAPGWKRMVAGSICGVLGAISCNPFELVKTRLQSSAAGKIAVGHQYKYAGVWDALVQTVHQDGIKGLYRGSVLSSGRSIVGSGTNLASYSMMKEYLILKKGWKDTWVLDMICGLGSGAVSCFFMNPIDVVRTRYYNQPYQNGKGMIYASGTDAVSLLPLVNLCANSILTEFDFGLKIARIMKTEGVTAFYKGFVTHFLRIGPHFCCKERTRPLVTNLLIDTITVTFVFLGVFRRQLADTYSFFDLKDSFRSFDSSNTFGRRGKALLLTLISHRW